MPTISESVSRLVRDRLAIDVDKFPSGDRRDGLRWLIEHLGMQLKAGDENGCLFTIRRIDEIIRKFKSEKQTDLFVESINHA